jgi:Holliday junction DNA helicase RuvA
MICRITGTITSIEANTATIDQPEAGIARQVLLPAYLADRLNEHTGRPITLHTIEYLEAQGQGSSFIPRLIGFAQAEDRRFFELFTTVKGLGNRRALRAMAFPPSEIAVLVAAKDAKGLQKLPEIGKRLAETVIAELTGKLDAFVDPGVIIEAKAATTAARFSLPPQAAGAVEDAIAVLQTLGQTQADAEQVIERALRGIEPEGLTGEQIVARVFGQG